MPDIYSIVINLQNQISLSKRVCTDNHPLTQLRKAKRTKPSKTNKQTNKQKKTLTGYFQRGVAADTLS